jgi:NADH:ubiquinone oxidoreductase subunit F (NADH-binding)/NADH:ubiquinone oxidoreductase subunit E
LADDGGTSTRDGGGKGRGDSRKWAYPKGRQVAAPALDEIRALVPASALGRDDLIENLHTIQDRHQCLSAAHLAALAEHMGLAQAEVYEVATFYAHFDVIMEGADPPPTAIVRVCNGIACELGGAEDLRRSLSDGLDDGVRVVAVPCVGGCDRAPVAVVGKNRIHDATADRVAAAVKARAFAPAATAHKDFAAYVAEGGYRILEALRDGERPRDELLQTLEKADLRGLGGAGFPVARKWRFLLDAPKPRLLAVNADEGEPGTFKDRFCLETDPHRVLEGALIAAWIVEADEIYIYLRDEYPGLHEVLAAEIARLESAGLAAETRFHLRRGAGSYVCGEESAMLESIEGKRGLPRNRPPYPAQRGLFGRPTLINNVETLYWLREILERGAEWYLAEGRPHLYSVSGRVRAPGVKRVPLGVTARQLIEDHAGGMAAGHVLKAYLPGGASGGILPAELADLPLDFDTLDSYGCFIGSSALVVISESDPIRSVVLNLLRFFAHESCGQCTPCRLGTEKMVQLLERPRWDEGLIDELSAAMRDASICGLGQAAPNPVRCAFRFFADEIAGVRCGDGR